MIFCWWMFDRIYWRRSQSRADGGEGDGDTLRHYDVFSDLSRTRLVVPRPTHSTMLDIRQYHNYIETVWYQENICVELT